MINACHIRLSYAEARGLKLPRISHSESHDAACLLTVQHIRVSRSRFRPNLSVTIGTVKLRPLISANWYCGNEFECQACGDVYRGEDRDEEDDAGLNTTKAASFCHFCRHSHICGSFVAIATASLEARIELSKSATTNIKILVCGAKCVALEGGL